MKNFACAFLLLAAAMLFAPAFAAAAPAPCDCALPIPPPPDFGDGVFGDTVLQPGAAGGTGVPTGRNVSNLTSPDGIVNLGDQPEGLAQGRGKTVSLPGLQGISFSVEGEDEAGADVFDLAIGQDRYFEAGQFKQTADGIELCF